MIDLLLKLKWWDKNEEEVTDLLPFLISSDLAAVKKKIRTMIGE